MGYVLNISKIYEESTGNQMMSGSLCAFPQLCANYPNSPVGLAVEILAGKNLIDFTANHISLTLDTRFILN